MCTTSNIGKPRMCSLKHLWRVSKVLNMYHGMTVNTTGEVDRSNGRKQMKEPGRTSFTARLLTLCRMWISGLDLSLSMPRATRPGTLLGPSISCPLRCSEVVGVQKWIHGASCCPLTHGCGWRCFLSSCFYPLPLTPSPSCCPRKAPR